MTVITRDRVTGTRSSLAAKAPCLVATTDNVTLAGQQTIDGIVVSDNDRVLVRAQDDASENGIYEVRQITNQAWVRAGDWQSDADVTTGTRVYVQQGTLASGEYYVSTLEPISVGTTPIAIDAYTNVGTGVSSVGGFTGAVTAAQIKTTYEANADTNALTDAFKAYLDTIAGVSGDGEFIVSTGAGTIAWESGATARASMDVYSTAEVDATIAGLGLTNKIDGPVSATDNAIVRYDGTSGKIVQDSAATVDDTGGITTPYINTTRGKIRISPYMTTTSSYVDQSAQLRQAFIDFFDSDTTHLDFEGRMVGISSQIDLVCGVDGFTSTPSAPKNFSKRIVNGGIRWLGPDTAGPMLRITCPTTISAEAAFKEPAFHQFRFDAGGGGTGYSTTCLEFSNFYHLKFHDCVFADFEDGVGVFLSSTDDSGNYTDDNGATFESCRFVCANGTQDTGTPILAYCGDIVVEGGWSDFVGPMDFHIGSVHLDRVHFVNNLNSPTNRRYAAIFRDPRAITVNSCDCDGGVFKFTNAGFLSGSGILSGAPSQLAATSFRNINVIGNRMEGEVPITTGEGAVTFETENAGTVLFAVNIADNTSRSSAPGDTPFLKVITTGAGTYTAVAGNYRYADASGSSPGDADFGAATHGLTLQNVSYIDESGVQAQQLRVLDTTGIWAGSSTNLLLRTNGTHRWQVGSAGNFTPWADNTYNIGSGSSRPATTYTYALDAKNSVSVGVDDTTAGQINLYGGGSFGGSMLYYQGAGEGAGAAGEYFSIASDGGNLLVRDASNNVGIRVNGDKSVDVPNGTLTAYVVDNEQTLTITPYMTAFDLVTDQSAGLEQAFIDFFDGNYQTLDLEGQVIILSSDIVLRCGSGGFTSNPNFLRNSEKRICNGKIVWTGAASGSSTTDYMIDIGCPQSVIASAAFLNIVWSNVVFDGNGTSKNLFRFFNFYNMMFDQCHFLDYDEAIAVFLSSTDDSANYVDDNGAIFHNCRWADLSTSDGLTGTPILAYCGDIVVDGGWAEWSGPMDFHIGSVTITGFHWSYGPYAGQTESRQCAIFRDPRGITLVNNDLDHANFYFTNSGFFGGTTHNAETNWRSVHISGNKYVSTLAPPSGEGIVTFETTVASTQIYNFHIEVGGMTLTGVSDNSVDYLRVISSGSGSYTTTNGIYIYNDFFGLRPGGDAFAPDSGATGWRTFLANDAFATVGDITTTGGTISAGVDLTTPGQLNLYGGATFGGRIDLYQGNGEETGAAGVAFNVTADNGTLLIRDAANTTAIRVNADKSVDMPSGNLSVTGNISVTGTVDGVDIAGRDHDAVTFAGTPDYLTLSGQQITLGQIDLSTDVTGTLPGSAVSETGIDHDLLDNFVANEHIDWTSTTSNFDTSGSLRVTGGINTSTNIAASVTDLSDHIALYSTSYGINVTSGSLNFVASGTNSLSATSSSVNSKAQHNFNVPPRLNHSYTVATLPLAGTVGRTTRITDGDAGLTFGQTAVNSGAGATPYMVWDNGTNWTVCGA